MANTCLGCDHIYGSRPKITFSGQDRRIKVPLVVRCHEPGGSGKVRTGPYPGMSCLGYTNVQQRLEVKERRARMAAEGIR